jgi:hypothetical protein
MPNQNEPASHHQLPHRRRTLDPTFSSTTAFHLHGWKFIPRPQADAYHRRTWGDRSTRNPIWTQETRLRTRHRRLRRETPENSFRRRADRLARRYGISRAADHDQRADEGWPTAPSDGPHRSMLVRPSPGRGRYPPDRARISIVHPLPARGIQTVDGNSPTSMTKISSVSATWRVLPADKYEQHEHSSAWR